mgnify:CR=1 FL=1
MITKEFLQYTGFCAPIISSLGCAIMLVLFRHTHAKSEEGTLHRLLVSYFLLVSLGGYARSPMSISLCCMCVSMSFFI